MKVLLCHTFYQQPGGEDLSFAAEADLLQSRGHDVVRFTLHNDAIRNMSRLAVACKTFWNGDAYRQVRRLIRDHRPEVMHCTNTFPLLSPAVYDAARAEGVPVVQSLRNYRMTCLNAVLLRDGKVCEDCLGKSVAWSGLRHRCYRGSLAASAVLAGMLAWHRWRGTWEQAVDLYFTPTEFARDKHVEVGLDPKRIAVKPNFIDPDPGIGKGGDTAVFVGRLDEGKGIDTLLTAWARFPDAPPLCIVGDGMLSTVVREAASRDRRIDWVGRLDHARVLERIGSARCLIMPSTWYETFGRTLIEAFARGTPVIASRLGAMAELVADGRTGLLFRPGDADDLAACLRRVGREEVAYQQMRVAARAEYLEKYTAETNHRRLIEIYEEAIRLAGSRGRAAPSAPGITAAEPGPSGGGPGKRSLPMVAQGLAPERPTGIPPGGDAAR